MHTHNRIWVVPRKRPFVPKHWGERFFVFIDQPRQIGDTSVEILSFLRRIIMVIDKKAVEYVASLSRLKVTESEVASICDELSTMLDYVDEISSTIDTDYIGSFAEKQSNIMRADVVSRSMDRSELLSNAPKHTDDTPIVPIAVR